MKTLTKPILSAFLLVSIIAFNYCSSNSNPVKTQPEILTDKTTAKK